MRYRKVFAFAAIASITVTLTGCASMDRAIEKAIIKKSGILDDEKYRQYQELLSEGRLNAEGYYADLDSIEQEEPVSQVQGSVHVTFADNRYISIDYFLDEGLTQLIDTSACYMNPGDTIYMSEPIITEAHSKNYQLSEYAVYEYDEEGKQSGKIYQGAPNGRIAYQIPGDYQGTEISIAPIGEYPDRVLEIQAFYTDDSGEVNQLAGAGEWIIDGEVCDDSPAVSAVDSHQIRFEYDNENYFYLNSTPECYFYSVSDDQSKGVVEFWELGPTDDDIAYSVELHPYLKLTLSFSEDATVSVNGKETTKVKKGKLWSDDKLKFEDKITIETAGDVQMIEGDYGHISESKEPLSEGARYTLVVQKEYNAATVRDLDKNTSAAEKLTVTFVTEDAYGKCSFKRGEDELSGETEVIAGESITLSYELTDSEYEFKENSKGAFGWAHNVFMNKNKREITITIDSDMAGQTITGADLFDIVKKKGK